MATVETRHLSKRFSGHAGAGVHAVDGIDLLVRDGEIMVGGQVVNGLPPRARQIAMVFQSYALYPHLNVYNNISFPLKAAKLAKDAQERQVQWAAGILGI